MYQLQLFLHARPATWPAITGMALCHKNVGGQWSNAWKVWKTLRPIEYVSGLRVCTRVGTLIVATIYLQLIQNSYMFRSFTVLQCSHQHCVQPVASDVEVVGYL